MPQCRYLLADMLWKEAQKKSKGLTDLSKVKGELGDLLFGARGKNGKRNNAGAYNHAINVYIRYPYSPWASAAEKTVGEIEKFMEEKFEKKIETKITPAQRAKVREMRFKNAAEKFGAGEFEPAIADYFDALAAYPEEKESVAALSKIVDGYYELMKRTTDREKLNSYRMRVDVVSGYLAERFAGAENMAVMNEAGNAVLSIAAKEKRLNELARADALYMAFICNYTRHALAPTYAAQLGGVALQDAMKLEGDLAAAKYREAIKYFKFNNFSFFFAEGTFIQLDCVEFSLSFCPCSFFCSFFSSFCFNSCGFCFRQHCLCCGKFSIKCQLWCFRLLHIRLKSKHWDIFFVHNPSPLLL